MANAKGKSKKGLGKGLGAFFEDIEIAGVDLRGGGTESGVKKIKVRDIEPNSEQPRKSFDKEKLEALAKSIAEHGLIQPIVVKKQQNGMYEIVAGERRWRASKLAGLTEVPCIEAEYSEKDAMEVALIENLQREDLNAIEEAEGYQRLMQTFGLKQEEVAERIGKSRSAVANSLRLNNLSKEIKKLVIENKLSQGHARALLSINDEEKQLLLAERIIRDELNVRQTEKIVSSIVNEKKERIQKEKNANIEAFFRDIEERLSKGLRAKVKIKNGQNKGKIEITYHGNEELENILEKINLQNM